MGALSASFVRRLLWAGTVLLVLVAAFVWIVSPGATGKKHVLTASGPVAANGVARAAGSQPPGGASGPASGVGSDVTGAAAGATGAAAGGVTGTTSGVTGGAAAGTNGGAGGAARATNGVTGGIDGADLAAPGSDAAPAGSSGTSGTTAAPGTPSPTVAGQVTTTTATTVPVTTATTTPPSGSTTATVTLHNTFAGAVRLNVGGQSYILVPGQTKGPITLTPAPSGNDRIEVWSAADPSCGVGDASKYFYAGQRYQVNVVSGPVKCQGVDGPHFQVVATG